MLSFFADNQYQFTGYEHTRIIDLLALLSVVSVIMWVIVMLSIALRHIAIFWFHHVGHASHATRDTDRSHDNH